MNLDGLIHGDLLQGTPPVAGLLGSEFLRRNQRASSISGTARFI